MSASRPAKILVAVSGSIAAYRCVDFVRDLLAQGYEVEVVLSDAATHFVGKASLETFLGKPCLSNKVFDSSHVGTDHIRWARWADAIVLYGATANRLAQLAQGSGNDMISLQLLAFKGKVLVAPAMNPAMWEHPAVGNNVQVLKARGYALSGPIAGKVACSETGVGHLQNHEQILSDLDSLLSLESKSTDTSKHVLISAGPMRSELDSVRFLQNSSSGMTGLLLAQEFSRRGYKVSCLLGPIQSDLLQQFKQFECEHYSSPADYRRLLDRLFPQCDLFVSASAVLDFEFQKKPGKLHYNKEDSHVEFEVQAVEDFVASVCRVKKAHQKVIAFALQTGAQKEQLSKAYQKLEKKACDAIVLNSANEGLGPLSDQGAYTLLLKGSHEPQNLGILAKSSFAFELVERLEQAFTPN